ncbi:MAG: putative Ig domain-containing protein [Streptosporangiaceae bacterium]
MNSAATAGKRLRSRLTRRRAVVSAITAGALVIGLLDGTGTAVAGTRPAVKSLQVTTASLPDGTGGKVYSAKLAATGGIKPYTWSITKGSLPVGLTLVPATGLINGVPTAGGTSDFTVAVTDSEKPAVTATAAESITVNVPQLLVTTTSLPAATAGVYYSAKLAATGGIKPYTWSISTGALPARLKLNAATGLISGTPAAGGSSSFTVEVTDGGSPPAAASAVLLLSAGVAPLVVTTASTLPTATTGRPYSVHLGATGGVKPYTWSVSAGSLPTGLKLARTTGIISGTPTTAGTATFTVAVTDAESPPVTATAGETLTVAAGLAVTTTSLPGGTADQSYSATLSAAGGVAPYTWSISAGSLPAGLSLDPETGTISGTPAGTGTAAFTAAVTDEGNPPVTATASLTLTVTASPLAVATTALPTATLSTLYSAQLSAAGGVTPYTWSISDGLLPSGLALDPSTGIISGTATEVGTFAVTMEVTDSDSPAATATANLSITVAAPLAVTTNSLPGSEVAEPYSAGLSASGGVPPYTWTVVSGLPPGLSLNTGTGMVSGMPGSEGGYAITVDVTDSADPATTTQAIVDIVVNPTLVINAYLPTATADQAYSGQLMAAGGVAPVTYSIPQPEILPPGLQLNPSTGAILGTPEIPGDFSFTIQATDSDSPPVTVSKPEEIEVAPPLMITSLDPPPAVQYLGYTDQLTATGGYQPYDWIADESELPPGMVLTSTGLLIGPAVVAGVFPVSVTLIDNNTPPGMTTMIVTIQVLPAPPPGPSERPGQAAVHSLWGRLRG